MGDSRTFNGITMDVLGHSVVRLQQLVIVKTQVRDAVAMADSFLG